MPKIQPATRLRTCRSCGKQFEYPLKGHSSTRHHCEECVLVDPELRRVTERLFLRIQKLELALKKLTPPSA